MMLDIAALQHIYAADFNTNSGNTTYSWNPKSGDAGADTFRFVKVSDSKTGSTGDVITDFNRGADHIDLSELTTTPFTYPAKHFPTQTQA